MGVIDPLLIYDNTEDIKHATTVIVIALVVYASIYSLLPEWLLKC